jgi:hypothetical protein
MTNTVPVVIAGVGALGRLFAQIAIDDPRLDLVGAIDIDPAKAGRSVGEIIGNPAGMAIPVVAALDDLLARVPRRPTVFVHMTESRPDHIAGPIVAAAALGLNVLSAAESMFYPWLRYPARSAQMHAAGLEHGVTITGTGINPGFVFDQLVLDMAAATTGISHIALQRSVEVSETGPGDVEHVGFGLPEAEFRSRIANGSIEGHMGLPESFVVLAERLDLPIDHITESWEPIVSAQVTPSAIGDIPPGHVVGIIQGAEAFLEGREVMTARLTMYFGEGYDQPVDDIVVDGNHQMHLRIEPASVSILGAANVLANTAATLPGAAPGLVSVLDLPTTRLRRSDPSVSYQITDSVPGDMKLSSGTPK